MVLGDGVGQGRGSVLGNRCHADAGKGQHTLGFAGLILGLSCRGFLCRCLVLLLYRSFCRWRCR